MWLTFYSVITFGFTLAYPSVDIVKIHSISEGAEMVLNLWFGENSAFNESCVAEACPALNNFNLCPNDTDLSVLSDILKTVSGCMKETFCGTTMDRRPCPSFVASADEWLPYIEVNAVATILPGTCFLSNLSNIEFEIQPNQHQNLPKFPLNIGIRMPDLNVGYAFRMDLSLNTMLTSIVGQPLSFTIPEASANIGAEFFSTIAMNRSISRSKLEINLINPLIKTYPQFCGLDMPLGFPIVVTMITKMTQVIAEKSSWAIRQGIFFENSFKAFSALYQNPVNLELPYYLKCKIVQD